jgi:hypothetical protein
MTELEERLVVEAEADLQQLLSIEPSPDFAAKVRARVHERHERGAMRWGWIGLAITAAAALILVAVLRTDHSAPASQRMEVVRRPDTTLHPDPPTDKTPIRSTMRLSHDVTMARDATRTAEGAGSREILIDPAMTDAIRRMAMALRNTEPDVSVAESLHVEEGDPAALKVAEPLNVPELVVKPADQADGSQNFD